MIYQMDFAKVTHQLRRLKNKLLLASLVAVGFFSACHMASSTKKTEQQANATVSATAPAEQSNYSFHLPLDVLQIAEEYKPIYVEKKLEDEEIDDSINITQHKKKLALEYEKAINTLYAGDVKNPNSLQQLLSLIKYTTTMFDNQIMNDLLQKRSKPLADFMVDYQVEAALKATLQSDDDQQSESVKDVIIAEQNRALDNLQAKYDALKRQKEVMKKQEKALQEKIVILTAEKAKAAKSDVALEVD